jgi:hypothetical protein
MLESWATDTAENPGVHMTQKKMFLMGQPGG